LTQLRKLNTFPFVHFKPARTMNRHSGEGTGNRPKWKTGNAWSVNDCCYCFQCRYAHALSCLCSHTWDVLSQVIACVISFVLFTDVVDVWWRKLVTPSAY